MNKAIHKQRKNNYKERAKELAKEVAEKVNQRADIQENELIESVEANGTRVEVNGRSVMYTDKNLSSGYGRGKYDGHINVRVGDHFGSNSKKFYERKTSIFEKVDEIAEEVASRGIYKVRKRKRRKEASNQKERAKRIMTDVFGAKYDWTWNPADERSTTVRHDSYSKGVKFNVQAQIKYPQEASSETNDEKVKQLMEEIGEKVDELNKELNK